MLTADITLNVVITHSEFKMNLNPKSFKEKRSFGKHTFSYINYNNFIIKITKQI